MSEAQIDQLDIEINVDTNQAVKNVNELQTSFNNLNSNLNDKTNKASTQIKGVEERLTNVRNKIGNIQNTISKGVSNSGNGKQGREPSSLSKIGTFINSVKRILFYRLIRTALKTIGEAFTTGIKNLYYYSKSIGSQFAKSMDSIATSSLLIKNSISVVFETLINAIAPIIDKIAVMISNVANKISEFMAIISGSSTWTKAIKYQTKYAQAVKNSVLGIDELNMLNGSQDNTSQMFTTEEVETSNDMIANMGKLLESFDGVRSAIENTKDMLRELRNNLDFSTAWESVKTLASTFVELADTMIGSLTPVINSVLQPILEWGTNNLLPKAIDLMSTAFSTLSSILTPIVSKIGAIKDALSPIIEYLGTQITAFFNNISKNTNKVKAWFDENGDKIEKFISKLAELISTIWTIVQPMVDMLLKFIRYVADFVTDSFIEKLESILDILTGLCDVLMGILTFDTSRMKSGFLQIFTGIVNGLISAINVIVRTFVSIVNFVIGMVEAVINAVQKIPGMSNLYDSVSLGRLEYNAIPMIDFESNQLTANKDDVTALLKQIAEKETVIEITSSSISEKQVRTQKRTGKNEVIAYE